MNNKRNNQGNSTQKMMDNISFGLWGEGINRDNTSGLI